MSTNNYLERGGIALEDLGPKRNSVRYARPATTTGNSDSTAGGWDPTEIMSISLGHLGKVLDEVEANRRDLSRLRRALPDVPADTAAWRRGRQIYGTPRARYPALRADEGRAGAAPERLERAGPSMLTAHDVLPADVITPNRQLAETALRPWPAVFVHGDLQPDHVFIDGDEVTGVIDWSEASSGDAHYDLAVLTLGHPGHLDDVIAGYDGDIDCDRIRAWWSWRCLVADRWLAEHGFGEFDAMPEVAVLRSHR